MTCVSKSGCASKEIAKGAFLDTGEKTMTGGRLKRVKEYVKNDEAFCFTYGDGLSNIDISKLVEFHKKHGKILWH